MRELKVVEYIVIHTAVTKPNMDIGAREIRKWHLANGWSDIGYHYVIKRDGFVEAGRDLKYEGAHVKGFNHNSLGICLVGGMDENGKSDFLDKQDLYTEDQLNSLLDFLQELKSQYPQAKIVGHRDLPNVKKTCPNINISRFLKQYGMSYLLEDNS